MFLTQTHSTYWNVRARGTKPRRVGQVNNNNASPKSFEGKQVEEDPPVTDINDNNSKSFELLKEDFPLLPSVGNTESSASQESERDKNSSSDQLIIEFGTYSISRSMTEMSLGTKDRKEDSGVSFSQGATPVVSSLAVKGKEKSMQIEEKMD